jgi:ATP-dependent helicase/nuclease subunit A
MIPIDNREREKALNPLQSFIVQAPAGSGKTELLTQRFLCLLAHTPQSPEEIVAITFTKKAAAEMRDRIISSLQLAQGDEPHTPHKKKTWQLARQALQRDQAMNWNILDNPNRLRIMTIDALSFHVNQMAPLLGELGCQPEIIDKPDDLYREAAENILTHANENNIEDAVKQLLLHLDNRVEYFIDLMIHMLRKREQWLPHTLYSTSNLDLLRQQLEDGLKQLCTDVLNQFEVEFNPSLRHQLTIIAAEAGRYLENEEPFNPLSQLATISPTTPIDIEQLALWQRCTELLLTKSNDWRKKVTKKQGFPAKSENKKRFEELLSIIQNEEGSLKLLRQIAQLPPSVYNDKQWSILQALMTILPVLVAHLRIIMQAAGHIDFTEITLSALRALGESDNPTDLALYLDHQIHHLLIDEFQDTSSVQFKLFEKLVSSWGQGEQQSIFLVGDPMQSIYRFRNAEVGLFLQAKHYGIGPIALDFLELKTNFRSQANIVKWINSNFSTIMPTAENARTGAIPYTSASPMQKATKHGVTLYANPAQGSDNHKFIIDIISSLPAEDSIAILVRSRSQLKHILPELHNHNIAFNAIDIEPLVNTAEIQDCLSLTCAILHREDDIAWLSILRAPWCGLTLGQIHQIYTSKKHSYYHTLQNALESDMDSQIKQRISHLYTAINNGLEKIGRLPNSNIIKSCWYALNGPATLKNQQAQLNCDRFFNLLTQLEQQDGFIDRRRLEQSVSQLYSSSSHADANVQIMTIHKSKGLEFDHVILPELQKKSTHDASQLLQWLERPNALGEIDLLLAPISAYGEEQESIYQYLQQTEKEKLSFESARLLYVACTRAKQSLHLAFQYTLKAENDATSINISSGSHLSLLWTSNQESWQKLITTGYNNASIAVSEAQVTQRLQTDQLHPVEHVCRTINHSDEQSELDFSLQLDPEHPRITGEIIHYELQVISEIGAAAWSARKRKNIWLRKLTQSGITQANIINSCIDKISRALMNTLHCDKGLWIVSNQHELCFSEYAINYSHKNKIKHLIIDRLIIDDQNAWIIDYKTAQPNSTETDEWFATEQEQYQPQLENYAATIKKLYPNHVIRCVLYFPLCETKWHEVQAKLPV